MGETKDTSTRGPRVRSSSTLEDSGSSSIAILSQLTEPDFVTNYRDAMRPVLLRGGCAVWSACQRWAPQYFDRVAGSLTVPVKTLDSGNIKVSSWRLAEYVRFIMEQPPRADEVSLNPGAIPYCHDIPLLGLVETLAADCQPFPAAFLSPWYRQHWWRYSQFFMGPAGTITPLHFDSLLSHNLFFQIYGTKTFTIIPPTQANLCGRRGWRWFEVDPDQPDYERFPQYRNATPVAITVTAGDMLYMPPGTLHHVRSLSSSISFNIDWHTEQSVLDALTQPPNEIPTEVKYYNAITALAILAKIPETITFPLYRPYLSYVS
ncbi:cupin-like domain-containing protein [Bradyrhizobium brasilense]|uniref:Cupin-like domain-containing protein n=1 Tax=Bradyrhizobium brasilense TaxID=1419277 RepID=A0ABY8JAR8_9BRAD|nr:cupin-like domain-containing protein [Bradyrhizobium brasilense]WFU62660.1 cupin-like domain-containing protein [Bradyrhizobium brasilense]